MTISRFFAVAAVAAASSAHADIVINEIMYHPSSELSTEEYVELHNTGLAAVSVGNWRLTKGR